MKVSGASQKNGVTQASGVGGGRQAAKASTTAGGASSDQVHLSGLGEELSLGVRLHHAAKLSQLASAVSRGGYGPETAAVSASIIENSLAGGAAA